MDRYEEQLWSEPIESVERRINALRERIADATKLADDYRNDPMKAIRSRLEARLASALSAYGRVDLSAIDMDRIPIVFARLQADEKAIREELSELDVIEKGASEMKKQLETARRVMAEMETTRGRQ